MKIRQATEKDIPQMLANGRTFATAAYPQIPYDESSFLRDCEAMISDGLCIVAVDEDDVHLGGVGARKVPLFINDDFSFAMERFWWVSPEQRSSGVGLRLLMSIEQAAKDAGCSHLLMLSLVGPDATKADAIYAKAGYVMTEHVHSKVLRTWVSPVQ